MCAGNALLMNQVVEVKLRMKHTAEQYTPLPHPARHMYRQQLDSAFLMNQVLEAKLNEAEARLERATAQAIWFDR